MMEWTESPALRGHMEAVAACMVAYAARMEPAEAERWFAAGSVSYTHLTLPTKA